ncbi:MAG: recombination protein RecO [Arcobacter butzleri]|jgi:recombinational DNA repair protein (RecF pathway)|nr:recombination protein RecO [Arcobacteraceae bacterium]MDY0365464.1 recombination protein RecO [Arcobacteraceae bacterium]NLO18071.1 recombination protein RecO [Aliarcobacter butzleri]
MQGFIIDIKKVKDEDLIVSILSKDGVYNLYRFYGARHSTLNIGYMIDFEIDTNLKGGLHRLKDVLQLGFSWMGDFEKMYNWQRFIKLFYPHLKEIGSLDEFYFNLLNNLLTKISKQNTKRALLEAYTNLLEYEGRLHKEQTCLLCEEPIEENLSLVRGFLPTHSRCSYSKVFNSQTIEELFNQKSAINLSDDEIDYLWNIILQGL